MIIITLILSPLQMAAYAAEAGEGNLPAAVEEAENDGSGLENGAEGAEEEVVSDTAGIDSSDTDGINTDGSAGVVDHEEYDQVEGGAGLTDGNQDTALSPLEEADDNQGLMTDDLTESETASDADGDSEQVELNFGDGQTFVSEEEADAAYGENTQEQYQEGMVLTTSVSATTAEGGESDNDELFSQYVENLFYPKAASGRGMLKAPRNMGSKFSGGAGVLYATMRELAQQIAAGQESSSILEIPVEDLGFGDISWSAQELGVDAIVADGSITDAASERTFDMFEEELRKSEVFAALRVDCPYELYWYDKTQGISTSVGISAINENGEWRCCVAGDYQIRISVAGEFALDDCVVDIEKTGAATVAVENAGSIIDARAGLSDQDKILAYISDICDEASYNDEAAEQDTPYGNPWQLIWVFDGDSATEVVCEGYSKAFQYLCDRSDFEADVCCYCVTGMMGGGTGAGPHMWNIVRMDDGFNYHIDVTNSDDGTVGQNGTLIMQPPVSGSVSEGYVFDCGYREINYSYDEDTFGIYSEEELTIADWAYGEAPVQEPLEILTQPEDVEAYSGDAVSFMVEASGDDLSYQWQYSKNGTTWTNCTSGGAYSDTFSFTMKDSYGGRWYRCEVSNGDETVVSDAANLKLKKRFEIIRQPEGVMALTGETVQLSVGASGEDLQYQWQYSKNNGQTWVNCTSKGYNTPSFSFLMKDSVSGRKYRCIVTSGDNTLISAEAAVELQLVILTQPEDVTAGEGSQAIVQVQANRKDASYQWQYSKNNGRTWVNCTSKGSNTDTFSFLVKESVDKRLYRCLVSAGEMQVISDSALITLSDADSFRLLVQPENQQKATGEQVILYVQASRDDVEYQWQYSKNGTTWTNCTSKGYNTDTFSFLMKASLAGRYYRCTVSAGTTTVISDAAYISMK